MSVKDVIKSSVYNKLGGGTGLQASDIILILCIACVVGVYMYVLYKSTSKNAFYSKDLAITLAGMPVIIAAIMIAMQSNLLVSLGMVGALSIVRFRTAVKNPLDLLYLFWSISAGIICGVGLYLLSIGLTVIMTILVIVLSKLPNARANSILVISSSKDVDWGNVKKLISQNVQYSKEKSRCIKNQNTELIFEIRTTNEDALIDELRKAGDFSSISILSHDGELRC